ncbi:hypothetical protein DQK91_22515 [Oceanidesulfovibrio marinus]|uniref:Helix-turn-helix domain-containing protein n=2 Tax=Oceanidesulfovibrio marinus TaxID=370038 RepID=A0A6P1ZD56_9BACT|nr:hypothetical protein DQK91_22515 [Oceanidesulfovibrio marinus]
MSKIVIAGLENMAQEMGCSKKTVYKWIRERDFPAFKLDGVWRVMPRDIEAWLAAQRAEAERCDAACATRGVRKAYALRGAPDGNSSSELL